MQLQNLPDHIRRADGTWWTRLGWWYTGDRFGFEVLPGVLVRCGNAFLRFAEPRPGTWIDEPTAGSRIEVFGITYDCVGAPCKWFKYERYVFDVRAVRQKSP